MGDILQVVVNNNNEIQWFVFPDQIINARNVFDIKWNHTYIVFTYKDDKTECVLVSKPEKTFRAIQNLVAGQQPQ